MSKAFDRIDPLPAPGSSHAGNAAPAPMMGVGGALPLVGAATDGATDEREGGPDVEALARLTGQPVEDWRAWAAKSAPSELDEDGLTALDRRVLQRTQPEGDQIGATWMDRLRLRPFDDRDGQPEGLGAICTTSTVTINRRFR